MKIDDVPQDNSPGYASEKRAVYARDAGGGYVLAASTGWTVEEAANCLAVEAFDDQARAARQRLAKGQGSVLEVLMYERRMDLPTLAQATGLWQWRVKRHLSPAGFAGLGTALKARYAEALGCSLTDLADSCAAQPGES
ncbi:hypothetical protein [Abyssibacter sp.]|uniref:hypothetical protein n=1 Tax=Abyssibacter sp. TaxID=2320200 RepID=UPI000C532893|nr:hypothetical protein [Abyssibacter sp.]MBB86224.1 hypothetical protein [Xanthomonadales bacterium]MCK5858267.1 hypothetical protein [Abyssibacter sp.]